MSDVTIEVAGEVPTVEVEKEADVIDKALEIVEIIEDAKRDQHIDDVIADDRLTIVTEKIDLILSRLDDLSMQLSFVPGVVAGAVETVIDEIIDEPAVVVTDSENVDVAIDDAVSDFEEIPADETPLPTPRKKKTRNWL